MNLASGAIHRPVGTVALSTVVIVLGVFYLDRLSIDLLPQIVYPQVRANVTYSGVAPEVLEEQVTKVLETSLATTENVVRLESETSEGRSGVDLHFRYGTDINFALQDASKNLDRARARLPRDADPATLFKFDPSQSPIYEVAFSSSTRSLVDIRSWADLRLRPQLLTVEGVGAIDVSGGLIREVRVTLDQERLRSYGLAVTDVLSALRDQNQDVAAGNLTSPRYEIIGKTTGKFKNVDDIRAVLLPVGAGRRIPLSEVATVSDTSREQRVYGRLDGVPAVRISVRKQPDANTVNVAEALGQRLEQLAASRFIPEDVTYEVLFNQSFFIENAVAGVREAAVLGALLSMVLVLFFLGSIRKTLVIGLSIPLAVLATFVIMGMANLSLNIMSLGGLALGVGMLVDNSIVILENIFRHKEMGKTADAAAHEGSHEVTSAVIASTTTHLAAVVPFLLISGLAALIFRELVLTISFAIAASLAVAMTLVPMLTAQLSKVHRNSGINRTRPLVAFNVWVERLTAWYRRVAARAVRRRGLVIGVAYGSLVLVFFLTRGLGSEFLPTIDDGNVGVNITMPPGTPPQRTNEIAYRLEALVRQMPHVRHIFTTAGGAFMGGGSVERGGRGSLDIQLSPATERDISATQWVSDLQRRIDSLAIPGGRIFARPPRIRGLRTNVSGSDIAISIQGEDLGTLQQLGNDVMRRVQGIRGLEALQPSTEEASPQLIVALDRQRAADLALNVAEVGQAVRTALDGAIPTRFADGTNEYDVRVRLPREQFKSPEDLGAILLFPGTARAQPVYLRDVADVRLGRGPTSILRINQSRQLRITGDVNDAVTTVGDVNQAIRARLADMTVPEGFALVYGGEEEAIRENARNLAIVMGLGIFLVFVVMAVQYDSIRDPLIIIGSVPLALTGVGLLLWLTRTPLSAPVLLGVVLLGGIVVSNAILLVEYVELGRRERGLSMEEAVVEAGAIRLRPILMTSATTVLGMLPLAIGLGEGTEMMRPLAISVVGGLTMSTMLTLIVIPCVYLVVHKASERLKRLVVGREAATEPVGEAAD
ncbi:MAG TPA: efflux RND transporter permease subunit [Gemmatimonadales bacterium]|nr:efflux RND transporter permease subunit [Gemmatimonadales bacterium]